MEQGLSPVILHQETSLVKNIKSTSLEKLDRLGFSQMCSILELASDVASQSVD